MVHVRDATVADRLPLIDFMAALNVVEHQWQDDRALDRPAADRHLAYLEDLVRAQAGFTLVAEDGAGLLGFLIGIRDQEEGTYVVPEARAFGYVTDIFVSDRARGRGIGRALMAEAERRFQAAGLPAVRVTALAANRAAGATYEALGYRALYVTYGKALI